MEIRILEGQKNMKVELLGDKELAEALKKGSELRFDSVCLKQLTDMESRAQITTPYKSGELVKSTRIIPPDKGIGGEFGYTKEYAPHVEYGHRQNVGQFVAAIGKRLKASYIPGQHFLLNNVNTQKPIFRQDLLNELKKVK